MELSEKYPNNNFLLMHMAQIEFSEAKFVINMTNNIHFITSHADNDTQEKIKKTKAKVNKDL